MSHAHVTAHKACKTSQRCGRAFLDRRSTHRHTWRHVQTRQCATQVHQGQGRICDTWTGRAWHCFDHFVFVLCWECWRFRSNLPRGRCWCPHLQSEPRKACCALQVPLGGRASKRTIHRESCGNLLGHTNLISEVLILRTCTTTAKTTDDDDNDESDTASECLAL